MPAMQVRTNSEVVDKVSEEAEEQVRLNGIHQYVLAKVDQEDVIILWSAMSEVIHQRQI